MCRSRARIDITSCLLTICRIASFVFCNSIAAPGTAHSKKSNRKSLETSTTEGSLRLRLSVRQASHEEACMTWHHIAMLRIFFVILVACTGWSATPTGVSGKNAPPKETGTPATRKAGLLAWQQIYSVLTHPRCINCHTATNYPQQSDDRHRHFANVVRGPAGKGVPALQCVTCHQEANADSTGVPGARDWHLAPLSGRQPIKRGRLRTRE